MRDEDKTKEQLLNELAEMRQRITELEASEAERKRMEEALRESEERFRAILERAAIGISLADREGRYIDSNPALQKMLGYGEEELRGMVFAEITHPDDAKVDMDLHEALMAGKLDHFQIEKRYIRRDGRLVWVRLTVSLIRGVGGEPQYDIGMVEDITERKWAEETLKEERNLLRTLIDNLPDYIYAKDTESRFVLSNIAAAREVGMTTPDEMLGKTDFDFFPEELAAQYYADEQAIFRSGQPLVNREEPVIDHAGNRLWVLATKVPLRDNQGKIVGLVGMNRDITERKRAEEALQRRAAQLELLNDIGGRVAAILELDSVLDRAAHLVQERFGYHHVALFTLDRERGELVMKARAGAFTDLYPPDHRLKLGQGMVGWVGRHGQSLLANDVDAEPRYVNLYPDQVPTQSELSVPIRVGGEVVGVLDVQSPQLNAFDENDVIVIETLADQVAVAIENARLYEQARQDAETKATLLQEVNHRVKNNLTAIIGLLYAGRRRGGVEDQPAYQSLLDDLTSRVQGLARVHDMLSASEWAPLPLGQLTRQIIHAALQMLPHDKRVSVDVTPSPVRVTPKQANSLALVINELTTNTVKYALAERSAAHIGVRIALRQAQDTAFEDEDDTVLFEFQDDGPGYPEEVLRLERFSVGLYLIQTMVRDDLGGELALHNDQGAVTTVRFKKDPSGFRNPKGLQRSQR